jgi:hypothetical protein
MTLETHEEIWTDFLIDNIFCKIGLGGKDLFDLKFLELLKAPGSSACPIFQSFSTLK